MQSGEETSIEETDRSGAGRNWTAVSRLCELSCGACLVLIAALTLYEIACRYVFDSPTQWTQDFSIYLMIWCAFLGLMPTDMAGQHIRIDIWYKRLATRPQILLELFVYISMAGFAAVGAWAGGGLATQSLRLGRRSLSLIPIPMWIPQAALVIGLGLFCLECVRRVVRAIIIFRRISH